LLTIILFLILPVVYRISISAQEVDGFWWDVHFRKVVLGRLDAIGYGVLMAYIKFYHGNFFSKARNWMFLLGLVLIYLNIYLPKQPNDFYSKTFYFCVTSLGASLLLSKADSIKDSKFKAIGRFVTYISVISYAMYLVNLSLVASVFAKNFIPDRRLENALFYCLFWFFTLLISTLIYRFYEKPITDLRDKF
jgi:peptidoglycan/LPS O-acetylase OafA/YrhL